MVWLAKATLQSLSRVAQWKRAGPITQRSVDRNHALLDDQSVSQPGARPWDAFCDSGTATTTTGTIFGDLTLSCIS